MTSRWHRYAECATDHDLGQRLTELGRVADSHGHENAVMHTMRDAASEVQQMRERLATIKSSGAASYVSAGFGERQLYAPLVACGLYEGETFQILESGEDAGVRIIFVGPQARWELMPFGLKMRFDNTPLVGEVCNCSSGF